MVAEIESDYDETTSMIKLLKQVNPQILTIVLTDISDSELVIELINQAQIFRFLNKPCPPEELAGAIEAALKQHELVQVERELLEGTVSGSVRMLSDVLGMVVRRGLSGSS